MSQTINHEGKAITMTQDAYPSTYIGKTPTGWDLQGEFWQAEAEDADGNCYTVLWDYTEADAEGDTVNWQEPEWVIPHA